jgi:hypothetical protein
MQLIALLCWLLASSALVMLVVVAVISGVFAIVWGLMRTGIVVSNLRQIFERQKKF